VADSRPCPNIRWALTDRRLGALGRCPAVKRKPPRSSSSARMDVCALVGFAGGQF
jgi:hypothetical protein